MTTDLACILSGITSIGFYDTLGKEAIEYIMNQTKLQTVVVQQEKIKGFLDQKESGKLPHLKTLICFNSIT